MTRTVTPELLFAPAPTMASRPQSSTPSTGKEERLETEKSALGKKLQKTEGSALGCFFLNKSCRNLCTFSV